MVVLVAMKNSVALVTLVVILCVAVVYGSYPYAVAKQRGAVARQRGVVAPVEDGDDVTRWLAKFMTKRTFINPAVQHAKPSESAVPKRRRTVSGKIANVPLQYIY